MIHDVDPYTSVGPVRFVMTREQVEEAVGSEPRRFDMGDGPADQFLEAGLIVHYDASGAIEVVETSAAGGATGVRHGDLTVALGARLDDLRAELDAKGVAVRALANDQLILPDLGISIFSSDLTTVASVAGYCDPEYYDADGGATA